MPLRPLLCALLGLPLLLASAFAAPPLVTGDVPAVDPGHFELFVGFRHQETGSIERAVPHTELVYGLAPRWELTLETDYLSRPGGRGFGDTSLGTKYVLHEESTGSPGVALSYEWKSDSATEAFGSGGAEHEARLRVQKTWGGFTPILNLGWNAIPDVMIRGRNEPRQDRWRAGLAQEWAVRADTKLLAEIYWRGADEPGGQHRLAWGAGVKRKLNSNFSIHAALGTSLRDGYRGGPRLRAYAGFKWEFAAPWTIRPGN